MRPLLMGAELRLMPWIGRLFAVLMGWSSAFMAAAYETDQFATWGEEIKDSEALWSRVVNRAIDLSIEEWTPGASPVMVADWVAAQFLSRQAETWAISHPDIAHAFPKHWYLYAGVGLMTAPAIASKGIAPTINLAGVHFGADKLSHFFGVGSVYLHYLLDDVALADPERRAHEYGVATEKTYWGSVTTGVYSNADLVANAEGMRFFRQLLPESLVGPSSDPKIIDWSSGAPRRVRDFRFSEYVNEYWSEVFNPNQFHPKLASQAKEALTALCARPEIMRSVSKMTAKEQARLELLYQHIGLSEDRGAWLMPEICDYYQSLEESSRIALLERQQKRQDKFWYKHEEWTRGLRYSKSEIVSKVKLLPHCAVAVERAFAEHQALVEFWQASEASMRQVVEAEWDQAWSLALAPNDERVGISSYQGRTGRKICERREVQAEPKTLRTGVRLFVEGCLEKRGFWSKPQWQHRYLAYMDFPFYRAVGEFDPILKNLFKGRIKLTSLDADYFAFDDVQGYVYRSIQPYCRWY